jgi:hypothetical protein
MSSLQPGKLAPEVQPQLCPGGLGLVLFIHEFLELYDNISKYKDKIITPKGRGVFAQTGKPVPPSFLQPGGLFGLGIPVTKSSRLRLRHQSHFVILSVAKDLACPFTE